MATPSKFDISSASPDRPVYTSGQRGSHLASQLDRSSSFRDSMENPILSSLPNMTRSSSVSQVDIMNFFQCLRFDPKVVAADHKSNRQGDFKQRIDVALGISLDDSGFVKGKMLMSCIPEEIKRVKAGLRESSVKARERMKIFNEALSVFNKFFPSVPSKKRSGLEGFPGDRAGALLSSDRPVLGPGLGKMGVQNHVITGSIELEQQKPGERPRNVVPNKRTRTSLVDVRAHMQSNAQVKPSGVVERDREISRPTNSGMILAEDRTTLSIGVDGWEKAKMRKKRSGIKPDVSTSIATTKPTDSYREPKPGLQQRPITDSRSRLNNDNIGFRLGVSNDAVGVGKSDGVVQPAGLSMRSSIPRADPDSSALVNEWKERPAGSDKDRVNFKAVNKANIRDELNSASPTSSTKMNATVRAPRSSTGCAPKSSPIIHRATGPNEWELSHCANNKHVALGANNRKRSAATRSSSPPVAHWAGQRPQKISRTARRTNLVPIVPSNEENAALDAVSDVSGNDTGLGFARLLNTNSPRQVKMKGEPSAATLSESEESGAPEIKSKEKGKRFEELEVGQNVQKLSILEMPSRKNKQIAKEELGERVRRQGRTGRGFASTRTLAPVGAEKLGNVGMAKQLQSSRLGPDKNESKPGRPPTRKLSDRKAHTRQKHAIANVSADFHDDGNEELLAAASDAINPDHGISGPFWRKMDSFFGFIFDDDIAYLKQQGKLELPSPIPSDVSSCQIFHNGNGSVEDETDGLPIETSRLEFSQCLEPVARDIPLFQRLLTAIIPPEDDINGSGELELEAYGTGFELDEELESNVLNNHDTFQLSGCISNGYNPTGRLENGEAEVGMLETPTMGIKPTLSPSANGFLSDQTMIPSRSNSEFLYGDLHISEKLLLEVESLGISIESMVEDGGISEEISNLEEKFRRQALKKKGLLNKLLNSAMEAKEVQEREFEMRAHDKLVTMAYEKYLACSGPHATGGKGSRNKMAKQAALAFVKWTLLQCHRFEDTGKSCFTEPLFREMFCARSSRRLGVGLDAPTDGESSKRYANSSSRSLEASVSSHPSPQTSRLVGHNGENNIASSPDLLPHVSNHLSEQDPSNEDAWSSRMKRRELLLDDVGGGIIGNSPIGPKGIGGTLPSTTKGKRSERDREGKGHNREVVSRSGTTKLGRPALYNAKGERKSKTKPKQKTAQLSVSLNGPVGKIAEQPKSALPSESTSSGIVKKNNAKEKNGLGLDVLNDPEDLVFSNLLGIGDDGQGNDLGAWLNIDDDGLQDHDFMGLEIPMDDLSDLNMIV